MLTLLFYRNTFPYYFVFLLAPVCVGISPSISLMIGRYGVGRMLPVIALSPVFLLFSQQYDVIERQRALVNEMHRLFPKPTGYLAYAGFIADYPRIIPHLISGVGLQGYHDRGIPVIAQEIERGNVGFVLADSSPVIAALEEGRELPNSLHPRDFAMLRENFIHYLGTIWIAGKTVCAAPGTQSITFHRPGPYSIDGGDILIDGITVKDGTTTQLSAGQHRIEHQNGDCIRLWAQPEIPRSPASYPDGPVMVGF